MSQSGTIPEHMKDRSDRLGKAPIGRLLLRLSIPGIIGMFIQSTYNVVDTMFVGRIGGGGEEGVNAITALSAVFPIQLLQIAIAVGTGVGVASLISRLLGRKDGEKAVHVANTAIFLSLAFWMITAVIGLFFTPNLIRLFVTDPEVVEMGSGYLRIIMLGSGSLYLFITAERILQAQGNTSIPMIVLGSTAILNIILDPVFIFGFWFVPALGVTGAAVATVLARGLGTIVIIGILLTDRNALKLDVRRFIPDRKLLVDIYSVGGPTMLIQVLGSIMLGFTNFVLGDISMTAIAVMGIYYKVQSFIMMPVFGIVHGFLPIAGYNFGAKKNKRVKKSLFLALGWSLIITSLGFILFLSVPGHIISLFNSDKTLVSVGEEGFRRIALLFFLSGPLVIMPSFFQAIGKGGKSLLILLTHRVLILFPAVLLLRYFTDGILGIWLAFPIATIWAFFLGTYLVMREVRKLPERNVIEKMNGPRHRRPVSR